MLLFIGKETLKLSRKKRGEIQIQMFKFGAK